MPLAIEQPILTYSVIFV